MKALTVLAMLDYHLQKKQNHIRTRISCMYQRNKKMNDSDVAITMNMVLLHI